MKYIELLELLHKPLLYFTVWVSSISIIIISIYDFQMGYILFTEIIRILLWVYLIYCLIIISLYFLPAKKEESK